MACDEGQSIKLFENFTDSDSVIDKIYNIVTQKLKCDGIEYDIQFFSCSHELTKSERQKIVRNHKSSAHKRGVLQKCKDKYASLEPAKKKEKLDKYKSMDPIKKKVLNETRVKKYISMDSYNKNKPLMKKAEKYKSAKSSNLDNCISKINNKIKEGPYYICSVCNRLLYRKSVLLLHKNKYNCGDETMFNDMSFDEKQYICKICHSKVSKGKIPCQAIYNNMYVDKIPIELVSLEKLEQILIAQRIVFEKIIVMPKGQQRKVKGAICNVPVECDQTCKVLPRPPERSGVIMLKLKRKLEFRGHVYFQAVRPQFIFDALNWLKFNNPLYNNITIDINNISANLTSFEQQGNSDTNVDINEINTSTHTLTSKQHINDNSEEREDPLNEYRQATNESCLQSVLPDYPIRIAQSNKNCSLGNEVYNIAPGENRHPVSIMMDTKCEELAFPVLFPKGQFGYTHEREIKLSPVKYFNARLLHYSGRFATNP